MEQKKVLWIIAAVGVFLLVVLGTALVLYTPSKTQSVTKATKTQKADDSSGWISLAPNDSKSAQSNAPYNTDQALFNSQDQNIPPVTNGGYYNNGATQEGNPNGTPSIYSGPLPPVGREPIDTQSASASSVATINITTDSAIAPVTNDSSYSYNSSTSGDRADSNTQLVYNDGYRESDEVPKSAPAPVSNNTTQSVKRVTPAPKAVTKSVTPKAPAPSVAPKKSATATSKAEININVKQKPKVTPKPATPAKQSLYWVQVTALTSKKSADNARNVLFDNKIMADIFTYTDKSGKLFYRVRVGPYSTKTEAEYWKKKIAAIDTFRTTQSYIAQTAG